MSTDIPKGLKQSLNTIRIDSLKLRLPLTLIEVIDQSILDYHIEVNLNTGEPSSNEYKRKFKEYCYTETSKVKLGIEKRITAEGKAEECLMVYLNSKALRERYFEGITIDNIELIYNDLMNLNAFSIQYENFLRSDCTDIDMKLDEVMNQDEWNELLTQFMTATIPTPQAERGYKRYKPTLAHPFQNGLMYNTRDKATTSRPFLKLYWKGGELMSKSLDYKDEHLKHIDQQLLLQIVRLETTIKNRKHAKDLGIENVTLLGLLSLTEKTKEKAFKQMFSKYLHKPKRQVVIDKLNKPELLSPSDLVHYVAIVSLMELTKGTPSEVIDSLIQAIPNKVSKSRQKTRLNEIYDRHIKGTDIDLRIDKINTFFNKFEWID